MFLESSGKDLSIPAYIGLISGYFNTTPINRVKYIISKFHETYIQLSYLFIIVRTRPMHLTIFRVNIWGYLIPTLINRVKYIISNTISESEF